ncbi:MAG TPA: nuclear transport factor 2 family protein [Sphingobium sp.]
MPYAKATATIDSPYEAVLELLIDKMERPKKYVGTIQSSRVVERGDAFIIREMYEPKPTDLLIREKIYRHPVENGEEFIYEHMNNKLYTGKFHNILTRIDGNPGQCKLEYIMDWTPHAGMKDAYEPEQANRMVNAGVNHMKMLAENPPNVPDFVRSFYDAVDSLKAEAMEPLLADNVRFRMGSHSDILGKARVIQLNGEVMSHWKLIKHHYLNVYEAQGKTFVEAFVEYIMADGKDYLLPFLTTFERDGDKITDIKVYGDPSPLIHGWPVGG